MVDEAVQPPPAEPSPTPEAQPPNTVKVDFTGEYRVGVVCNCECGKIVIIPDPSAIQAALLGAGITAQCAACKKTGMFKPAPGSARMRPNQTRRAMAKGAVPPGFRRTDGGMLVPR